MEVKVTNAKIVSLEKCGDCIFYSSKCTLEEHNTASFPFWHL